jgi:hypothetical protein
VGNTLYPQGLSGIQYSRLHLNEFLRLDQTTRIHAALPTDKGEKESMLSWHEIGRPQVHGYDLVGVVSLDPLRFITVADEKVARVFGAPRGFVQTMRGLGAADLSVDEVGRSGQHITDPLRKGFETGEAARERDRSTIGPIQQGHERRSGSTDILSRVCSLEIPSSSYLILGLTSAIRSRACFRYALARSREGFWSRL